MMSTPELVVSAMSNRPVFRPTQRVGIFVFDGFEPIDVFGFAEAFTIARFFGTKYSDPPPFPSGAAGRRSAQESISQAPARSRRGHGSA
jgi:hypothetical protein